MRFEGSAALKLDFGGVSTTWGGEGGPHNRRHQLRLAPHLGLTGPGKYEVLERRRRQAQIKARRLLDMMEEAR